MKGNTMQEGAMQAWIESSPLAGGNAAYVEELFELFLDDPSSIPAEWRELFDQLPATSGKDVKHSEIRDQFRAAAKNKLKQSGGGELSTEDAEKQVRVLQLINAYRFRGHQHANLDPLGLWKQEQVPDLSLEYHNLGKDDLAKEFNVGSRSEEHTSELQSRPHLV